MVVNEFRSLCAEQKVSIRYQRPREKMLTLVDPDRFAQVVRNL